MILTCRTPDGTGSGWAGTTGLKDVTQIDAVAISEVAAGKALASRKPRAIEPGTYTVILEPRPAARFLSLMLGSLAARQAEEGRSFMSGAELGSTKLGQKVFGDNVTIRSDIGNTVLRQTPIGPDGLAAKPVTWIEKGVVKNLAYDRFWANKQGKAPTLATPNMSLVMEGGDQTLEQMIKSTRRGLLVSFFWYIRVVDAMTLLNTGMTRDGLFLIENGEIAGPVQNFRWNDGPARGFNNISALGKPVPMHVGEAYDNPGTALVPPMKIEDFRMTSISPAVVDAHVPQPRATLPVEHSLLTRPAAATFSIRCATFDVPAMGSITGLRLSVHASAIWLGVALRAVAMASRTPPGFARSPAASRTTE